MFKFPIPVLLAVLLYSLHLQAAPPQQLDTSIWSFDTASRQIFFGNTALDTFTIADSALRLIRTPAYWRTKGKKYNLPDTLLVGTMPVSTVLMLDKKIIAQGALNRWLNDNRAKLPASMAFIKPPFITTMIMLLKKCVQEVQEGTAMTTESGGSSKFVEWSLTDRFYQAKKDMVPLNGYRDTLKKFLEHCPDTTNAFYSYKKLFQIAVLLDVSAGHAAQYCSALESADKDVREEVAAINSWINDVLLSEMIALESFCFQNVPTAKPYCYEDLIEYVINAEKRGMVRMSVEDLGKIRVRR